MRPTSVYLAVSNLIIHPILTRSANLVSAFLHHGQICFSTERIIVHESVAQEFIALLIKEATGFDAGSGVTKDLASKACAKLVEAEEKGAKFIVGSPQYVGAAGLRPSLVTGVTKNMSIFDEETFGPSAAVYIVKDDEEAIQTANDSEYGLNAAIHTRDMYRGVSMGRRLEVGQVHINSLTENDERKCISIQNGFRRFIQNLTLTSSL